jgi:DNA-directed RNA polymerase specialized sigma24 family protein
MESCVEPDPASEVERLFVEQASRLWKAIFAYTSDSEIASDSVAEAFAQALRRGTAIANVEGWVWTAAFRIAAGEVASRSSSIPPSWDELSTEGPGIEGLLLVAALRQLSPFQRAALVLRYYADYPTGDIASILGTTRGAVRVHLTRGRKKLRALLEVGEE